MEDRQWTTNKTVIETVFLRAADKTNIIHLTKQSLRLYLVQVNIRRKQENNVGYLLLRVADETEERADARKPTIYEKCGGNCLP